MYVVFGLLVKLGSVEHYAVYLLLGIVLWTFFAEATNQGMSSIINRGDLIRKISFPKYIIVLSTTISALINLTLNLIIVAVLMVFNGVSIAPIAAMLPLYILEIYLFSLGLAFFLSALNIKYRETAKSELAAKIIMMNPVAQAVQDARHVLVTTESVTVTSLYGNQLFQFIPILIVIGVFVGGVLYFNKHSKYFAENI